MSPEALDATFTKLSLTYGRDFLHRYDGLDLSMVKADWRIELGSVTDRQVKYALQNLPPRPPNVIEFRSIALRAPAPVVKAIAAPTIEPRVVKERIKEIKEMLKSKGARP